MTPPSLITDPAHTDLAPSPANPPSRDGCRRDVVAGSDRAVLLGCCTAAAPNAAVRAAEGAADGVAGVAHGIGCDAEEAQGHRGSQRRVHPRPQGTALPHAGGGTQARRPRRRRRGLRRVPPRQDALCTRRSPRGEEFRR
jgi:hypothetical protein